MPKRRLEVLRADDSGKAGAGGLIAPDSPFDVVVRVRERSALNIAVEETSAARLKPLCAVIVWDETSGRKTGQGLWATHGSLTVAFVLPALGASATTLRAKALDAVKTVLGALVRDKKKLATRGDKVTYDGKELGLVVARKLPSATILYVGIHSRTELKKAPADVVARSTTLVQNAKPRLPTEWQLYGRIGDAVRSALLR